MKMGFLSSMNDNALVAWVIQMVSRGEIPDMGVGEMANRARVPQREMRINGLQPRCSSSTADRGL